MKKQLGATELRNHLKNLTMQERLRQGLQKLQQQMTTDVTNAADITGTTPSQLRNWEKLDLLFPKRMPTSKHSGERRYSYRDLAKILIINELQKQTPYFADIAQFLKNEGRFIEEIVDKAVTWEESHENSRTILQRINEAEQALFWRIFVPRAMYLSLCLLFEEAISGSDAGLLLPVGNAHPYHRIATLEHLPQLSEVILGWQSKQQPFCAFLTDKPIIGMMENYQLIPLEWPRESISVPENAYLVVEKRLSSSLATTPDNARRVAGRILRLLQDNRTKWKSFLRSWDAFMLYYSPDFRDTKGNLLLNEMAEMVVELGDIQKTDRSHRWRFCCILLPEDLRHRWQERSERNLKVQAQSEQSPYEINETILPPNRYESMSSKAYQTGRTIYKPSIADEEPGVANLEIEGLIRSAIALPIERRPGSDPQGVMYVVSDEPYAFSEDDQVLLRIMGRIIAEQQITSEARGILVDKLSEVTAHPQMVHRLFREFVSEDQFVTDLENLLEQIGIEIIPEARTTTSASDHATLSLAIDHLSLIVVDIATIDKLTEGDVDKITKFLVALVGKRLRPPVTQDRRTSDEDIRLYYTYSDQFYLLLKNTPLEQAEKYAQQLYKRHKRPYALVGEQKNVLEDIVPSDVPISIGVTGYTRERLQEALRKHKTVANTRLWLTNLLEEAISVSKKAGGDNVTVWDMQEECFRISHPGEARSGPSKKVSEHTFLSTGAEIDENVLNKIVDMVAKRLKARPIDESDAGPDFQQ